MRHGQSLYLLRIAASAARDLTRRASRDELLDSKAVAHAGQALTARGPASICARLPLPRRLTVRLRISDSCPSRFESSRGIHSVQLVLVGNRPDTQLPPVSCWHRAGCRYAAPGRRGARPSRGEDDVRIRIHDGEGEALRRRAGRRRSSLRRLASASVLPSDRPSSRLCSTPTVPRRPTRRPDSPQKSLASVSATLDPGSASPAMRMWPSIAALIVVPATGRLMARAWTDVEPPTPGWAPPYAPAPRRNAVDGPISRRWTTRSAPSVKKSAECPPTRPAPP